MLYSEQPTVLLGWRHLNTMLRMLLANFQNLNSISKTFQETHDFLVLTGPVIICIYLWRNIFVTRGTSVILVMKPFRAGHFVARCFI